MNTIHQASSNRRRCWSDVLTAVAFYLLLRQGQASEIVPESNATTSGQLDNETPPGDARKDEAEASTREHRSTSREDHMRWRRAAIVYLMVVVGFLLLCVILSGFPLGHGVENDPKSGHVIEHLSRTSGKWLELVASFLLSFILLVIISGMSSPSRRRPIDFWEATRETRVLCCFMVPVFVMSSWDVMRNSGRFEDVGPEVFKLVLDAGGWLLTFGLAVGLFDATLKAQTHPKPEPISDKNSSAEQPPRLAS